MWLTQAYSCVADPAWADFTMPVRHSQLAEHPLGDFADARSEPRRTLPARDPGPLHDASCRGTGALAGGWFGYPKVLSTGRDRTGHRHRRGSRHGMECANKILSQERERGRQSYG